MSHWLIALQIHVDDYRLRLYQSLRATVADGPTNHVGRPADGRRTKPRDIYLAPEASALCGYRCGNNDHPGCLTSDQDVRLHSCEAGTDCKALKSPNVVWITPIIAHSADGSDVLEIGAGGGVGDLNQHELELDDQETMELLQLCVDTVKENSMGKETENMVSNALLSPAQRILLDSLSPALSDKELPLKDLARIIVEAVQNRPWKSDTTKGQGKFESNTTLPRQIVRTKRPSSMSNVTNLKYSDSHIPGIPRMTNSATWSVYSDPRTSIHARLT